MRQQGSEQGYTLIEVLVAASIFVGVLILGTTSLTTTNRLQQNLDELQETTQVATYIIEAITRDVQSATGLRVAESEVFQAEREPFQFMNGSCTTVATPPVRCLRTVRFDPTTNTVDVKSFRWSQGDLVMSRLSSGSQSVVPEGFVVTDLEFSGIAHVPTPRAQPYVQLKFTLENKRAEPPIRREFSTLVTSREFFK